MKYNKSEIFQNEKEAKDFAKKVDGKIEKCMVAGSYYYPCYQVHYGGIYKSKKGE